MSARPKSNYEGRGVKFQVILSDDEHKELVRQAAGYKSLSDYIRVLVQRAVSRPLPLVYFAKRTTESTNAWNSYGMGSPLRTSNSLNY